MIEEAMLEEEVVGVNLAGRVACDFTQKKHDRRRAAGQGAFPRINIFFLFLKPDLYFPDKHFHWRLT